MVGKLVLIFVFIILRLARKKGCQDKIKRVDSKKNTTSIGIGKKLSIFFIILPVQHSYFKNLLSPLALYFYGTRDFRIS